MSVPDLKAAFEKGRNDIYEAAALMLPFPESDPEDDDVGFMESLSSEDGINGFIRAQVLNTEEVPFEKMQDHAEMLGRFLDKPEYQGQTQEAAQIRAQAAGRLVALDMISETVLRLRHDMSFHPDIYTKCSELKTAFENIAVNCTKVYKDDNGAQKLHPPESLVSLAQTMRPGR